MLSRLGWRWRGNGPASPILHRRSGSHVSCAPCSALDIPNCRRCLPELAPHQHRIADAGRHRRMFNEIVDVWESAFAAGEATRDLSREAVEQLVIGVWGAWRYVLLVRPAPTPTTN